MKIVFFIFVIERGRRFMRRFFESILKYKYVYLLYLLLFIIPPILLFTLVIKNSVNIPFWDQWRFIPLLKESSNGSLNFHDLWVPHNEHRIFFPKLIMLGLAYLTGWNINYEIAMNVILGILIYCVFSYQSVQSFKKLSISNFHIVLPIISFITFSIVQWENWTWGWQIQIFLNVLAVLCGIVCITRKSRLFFILAAVFGIVATFSFANGLLFWEIGFCVLVFMPYDRMKKLKLLILWAIISVGIIYLFFVNYHHQQNMASGFSIKTYLEYIFAYLGSPIAGYNRFLSIVIGLLGVLLIIILSIRLKNQINRDRLVFLPWLAMATYSMASACLTGLGRGDAGFEQALSSRYTTISMLLWVAITILLVIEIKTLLGQEESKINSRNLVLSIIFISIILTLMVNNSIEASKWMEARHDQLIGIKNELLKNEHTDHINELYPSKDVTSEGLAFLRARSFSLFKNTIDLTKYQVYKKMDINNWIMESSSRAWTINGNYNKEKPDDASVEYILGSWSGSDHNTGKIQSEPVSVQGNLVLIMYIQAGPDSSNQNVGLDINGDGDIDVKFDKKIDSDWTKWVVDLSKYNGKKIKIVAKDQGSGWGQWIGISQPVFYIKK